MKTKLLSKIREKYDIVKPNGLSEHWIARDKNSTSKYPVARSKSIETVLYCILFDLLGDASAKKMIFGKLKRFKRYYKCCLL